MGDMAVTPREAARDRADLRVADDRDALIDHVARRIRHAQHVGGREVARTVAVEFVDRVEQQMIDAHADGVAKGHAQAQDQVAR